MTFPGVLFQMKIPFIIVLGQFQYLRLIVYLDDTSFEKFSCFCRDIEKFLKVLLSSLQYSTILNKNLPYFDRMPLGPLLFFPTEQSFLLRWFDFVAVSVLQAKSSKSLLYSAFALILTSFSFAFCFLSYFPYIF